MLFPWSLVGRLLLAHLAVAIADPAINDASQGKTADSPEISGIAAGKSTTKGVVSSISFSDQSSANAILYYSFESMVWQVTLGVAMVTQNVSAVALQAALADFNRTAHANEASLSAPSIQLQSQNLTFNLLPLNSTTPVQWGWAQAVTAILPSLYARGLPEYDRTVLASVRHPSSEGSDYMVRIEQADDAARVDFRSRMSGPSRALLTIPNRGSQDFYWESVDPSGTRAVPETYHVAWEALQPQAIASTQAYIGWTQLQALIRRAYNIAGDAPPLRLVYRGLRAQYENWHLLIRVPQTGVDGHRLEFYTHMVVEVIGKLIQNQLEQLIARAAGMALEQLAETAAQFAMGFQGTIKNQWVEAAFKIEHAPLASVPESERNAAFGDPVPRRSPDEL